MNERCQKWNEKQLVDGILGKLPEVERERLNRHLLSCRICREQYAMWSKILAETPQIRPPERVKSRLLRKAERKLRRRRRIPLPVRQSVIAVPLVLCILFVAVLANIGPFGGESSGHLQRPAHDAVQEMVQFASVKTRSPSLKTVSIEHNEARGTAWINMDNLEIVMYIEGVRMEDGLSLVRRDGWQDVGLLKWNGDSGYIYLKAADKSVMHDFSPIIELISVEPGNGGNKRWE